MDVFYQKEIRKKMHIKSHWYDWSINFIPQAIRKLQVVFTGQKMKFSIKDFFSKCDQIYWKLWIWSHLLKKFLMGNVFPVQCI